MYASLRLLTQYLKKLVPVPEVRAYENHFGHAWTPICPFSTIEYPCTYTLEDWHVSLFLLNPKFQAQK